MAFAGRLFQEDDAPEPDWRNAKLREIFDQWFVPKILRSQRRRRRRPASEKTIRLYRDSIAWWEATSGNPPASAIDDERIDDFLAGLDAATYRRGPCSPSRKLSEASKGKHIRQIQAILGRLHVGAAKPRLEILQEAMMLPVCGDDYTPKPAPDLATFKHLFDHLQHAVKLRLCAPPNVQPVDFWRALLATLYCHGWRLQTALALDWSFFEPAVGPGAIHRLRVPGEVVAKTHKPAVRPVPEWLLVHWRRQNIRFRTGAWPIPTAGPIFAGPAPGEAWLTKTLDRSWKRLQRAARPGAKLFSLHSLRRLHGDALDDVGFSEVGRLVKESLQHSSEATTQSHYKLSIERAILRLPEV